MSGGRDVQNGGQGFGGGEQGEMLEGSLTDGGSVPGNEDDEDRRFGAGREAEPQGAGSQAHADGSVSEEEGDAGPAAERSGYGNTPQR